MFKSRMGVVAWLGNVLLIVTLAGCGRSEVELGTVTGRVTLDGDPLRGVFIVFQPDNRKPALALLDSDGKFTLRYNVKHAGTVVGKQGVYLRKPLADQLDEVRESGIEEPSSFPKKFEQIFETVDVKSGRNHFDLELTSS